MMSKLVGRAVEVHTVKPGNCFAKKNGHGKELI